MALKLITAATSLAITLAEAKLQCRVDSTDDDALITAMITAATEMAEQETGRAIMQQTWDLTLDAFPEAFELTKVPVRSITSVTYIDGAGVTQTVPSTDYTVDIADDNGPAFVVPAYGTSWPTPRDEINAVSVRFVAGYLNAASVPESLKHWIKMQVSAMYENRSTELIGQGFTPVQLSFARHLLDRHKVYSL